MSHYSHLKPDVLSRLFKSYCCSFLFLWQYNCKGFEKMCITWNNSVRKSMNYHMILMMTFRPIYQHKAEAMITNL